MLSGYHICAPLLPISQQASTRNIFIDEKPGLQTASCPATATGPEVLHRVALLSRALSTCLSITPGSVVVLIAHTSSAMMESMLGVLDAGCILCPVNWRWSAAELAEALGRLQPALVLYDIFCADLAQRVTADAFPTVTSATTLPAQSALKSELERTPRQPVPQPQCSQPQHFTQKRLTLCLIDHWQSQPPTHTHSAPCKPPSLPNIATTTAGLLVSATAAAPDHSTHSTAPTTATTGVPPAHPPCSLQLLSPPCGTALLVFTSGTTAAPKAVRLSHAAFHAQSLVKLALVGYRPADTYLHLAPLFHIGGLSSAFAALQAGAAHVFLPRFEPAAALRAIVRHHVSAFIAVPTMLQDLATAAAAAAAGCRTGGVVGLGAASASGEDLAAGAAAGVVAAGAGPALARAVNDMSAGEAAGGGGGLAGVRLILVGAGGTSPVLQEAVSRTFPCADLMSAYGMTEACSSMTFHHLRSGGLGGAGCGGGQVAAVSHRGPVSWAPPLSPRGGVDVRPTAATADAAMGASGRGGDRGGGSQGSAVCVGWPAPGVQVMVAVQPAVSDDQTVPAATAGRHGTAADAAAPSYTAGEVLTRGPHVMLGYWGDPEATKKVLTPDGWLRTGDLGYLAPDGALWLLGRAKDMVKSGGENVFAPQVEAVLCRHPAVEAAAVVGLPDERLGEQVAALLVLRPGWAFDGPCLPPVPHLGSVSGPPHVPVTSLTSLGDLQAHCRSRGLAGFRLPRYAAAQWGPLPVNSSGKVQKPVVRQRLVEVRDGGSGEGAEGGGSGRMGVVAVRSKL